MDEILLVASNTLKKYGVYLLLLGCTIGAMVAHKQKVIAKKEKMEVK